MANKIDRFRGKNVTLLEYNPNDRTIILSDGRWFRPTKAKVSFNLEERQGALWLAFSGDAITGDGQAIARILQIVWDKQLPSFGKELDERLCKQLGKQPITPAKMPEDDTADNGADSDNPDDPDNPDKPDNPDDIGGGRGDSGDDDSIVYEPVYVRDMAFFIAGLPQSARIITEGYYQIDNSNA